LNKSIFLIFLFFLLSCSSSPRYSSSNIYYGISSFYGLNDGFDGQLTANGEIYDKDGLSAAHKTLPLNSIIEVTNLENGKSVRLKVNDRGPYIDGRILDCSYGAAKKLDFVNEGTTNVRIEIIKWGDNVYKKQK
tara:strand:- start:30 stop:431 length:402 start_codon:yes stop_codon:yes gene_type:complete